MQERIDKILDMLREEKSYGDLVVKMDMQEIAKREKRMKTDNAKNEEGEEL